MTENNLISIRLPADIADRLDAVVAATPRLKSRSEFIRNAIEEALAGPEASKHAEKKVVSEVSGLSPDAEILLAVLRGKPMTAHNAEKVLGWPAGRVAKAEKALADCLEYPGGGVMAVKR